MAACFSIYQGLERMERVWGTGQLVLLCPCVAPPNVPRPRSEIENVAASQPHRVSPSPYAARVPQSQKHVLVKCSQNIATSSVEPYISGSMASVPDVDCHHPDQLKTNQMKDALIQNSPHLLLCCLAEAKRPSYQQAKPCCDTCPRITVGTVVHTRCRNYCIVGGQ
ncbi:hypothetical protein IG631_05578 [Alternaria alternata]|nr:hypothetical protein IG631_05578 [Alternaria alternata]